MNSVVCTLFEGDYHYGVAALVNSLYERGFRGQIFAGYKGVLPNWASNAVEKNIANWPRSKSMEVKTGIQLHFLPLTTTYHLTNYKPDFILNILNSIYKEATSVFYFDPDIIVNAPWSFFEEWILYGVALCEDVNSPLSMYHPRRMGWRSYFQEKDISLLFKESIYVNGGFIGITKEEISFVEKWKLLQDVMSPFIGGLNRSSLKGEALLNDQKSPFSPFGKTDQDALNAAIEAWDGKVSFVGKEGMAFKAGAHVMSHALGQPKPWNRKHLIQMFDGRPPRLVDREYWNYSNGVINTQTKLIVLFQIALINITTLIGRFYRRG